MQPPSFLKKGDSNMIFNEHKLPDDRGEVEDFNIAEIGRK
jgi:hypothetical protein